jgi:hypothetical protein
MILSDKDRAMSHAKVEGKLMMSVTVKKQKAIIVSISNWYKLLSTLMSITNECGNIRNKYHNSRVRLVTLDDIK